jgi:hypothetical protein
MSYKEIMNYKDLKHLAIEEIKERLFENMDVVEVVRDCVKELEQFATKDWLEPQFLIDILKAYGWNVICIDELKSDLRNLEEFYARNHKNTNIFSDLISLLSDTEKFKESE